MASDATAIARRSPWPNAIVSVLVAGVAIAFSIASIRDGFDVIARPWAEKRLWLWWLSAYVLSPALMVMLGVNFWRLACNRFVAISLEGRRLHIIGVTRQSFDLEDLTFLTIQRGALTFILGDGREVQVGLLGLEGSVEAIIERIKMLRPEVQIR